MKAFLALVCLFFGLATARNAEAAEWKGKKVIAATWNYDPRLLESSNLQYNAYLAIILEDVEGDTTEYFFKFKTWNEDTKDYASGMFSTAKEALIHEKPLWLLIEDDLGIIAVALGEIDPSRVPSAVSRKGRISSSGSPVQARGLFAGSSGPRDILGRSRTYNRPSRPSRESAE